MTVDSVLDETSLPTEDSWLTIDIVADETTGYAAIQNNVPVVRAIVLTNSSEKPLTGVEILVGCSPAFAVGARFHFDSLAPGEKRKIAPIDLQPDHGYLSRLDEAEQAACRSR